MLFDKRLIHIAENLILVPYLPRHVPKYHGWMSNEQILQQTASEPLSLEEEFAMQITWATDEDKRTCILIPRKELHHALRQSKVVVSDKTQDGDEKSPEQSNADTATPTTTNNNNTNPIEYLDGDDTILMTHIMDRCAEQRHGTCSFCDQTDSVVTELTGDGEADSPSTALFCCLLCESNAACGDFGVKVAIGDVNLFLHDYLQDDDDDDEEEDDRVVGCNEEEHKPTVAEVEIMIAEVTARRRGFGEVAVKMLTQYAVEYLQIQRFIAKINDDNHPSQALFEKKLGYKVYAKVECFDETHLDWRLERSTDYPFYPCRNLPSNYVHEFWKQAQ